MVRARSSSTVSSTSKVCGSWVEVMLPFCSHLSHFCALETDPDREYVG